MFKFFIPIMFLIAACGNQTKADYEVQAELKLIDTLNIRLLTVKSWLDKMPLEEIKERKEIVFHNLEFIEQEYVAQKLILDEEDSRLLDEYKGYGKLYRKLNDSFKPIVMETEELFIQLKTLKESAYSKDYKKETFLTYFYKERDDVMKLYSLSETLLKPMIETDLDFERAQKKVEELAESLKENRDTDN